MRISLLDILIIEGLNNSKPKIKNMNSFVNYNDFLKGEYLKQPFNPMQGYYENKGADFKSNAFFDKNLKDTGTTVKNLMELIKSGRQQEFTQLSIACLEDYVADFKKFIEVYKDFQLVDISFDIHPDNGLTMVIKYPELIKIEKEIQPIRSRTKLHSEYMEAFEIDELEKKCYPNLRNEEQKNQLLKKFKDFNNQLFGLEDLAF